MAILYSTGPIAHAPTPGTQVNVFLLNNHFRAASQVVITLFSIAGAKQVVESRTLTVPPQRGVNNLFNLSSTLRSYEVQITVDGADESLLASVWQTRLTDGGLTFQPEKRVLHSELVSRSLPFVPIIPLPPIIRPAGAGVPQGAPQAGDPLGEPVAGDGPGDGDDASNGPSA